MDNCEQCCNSNDSCCKASVGNSDQPVAYSSGSDDGFGDYYGDDYDKRMAEREIARLHAIHHKAGYAEGIVQGKDEALQKGFDEGLSIGMKIGFVLSQIPGLLSSLKSLLSAKIISTKSLDPQLNDNFLSKIDQLNDEALKTLSKLSSDDQEIDDQIWIQEYLEQFKKVSSLFSDFGLPVPQPLITIE